MKNKFFYFFLLLLFLTSCGYKPIYSSKNLNFSIGNINKNNTSLNNKFAKSISALVNSETSKKMDIDIDSNKTIKIKSKDPKGNALVFELEIYLKFSTLIMDNKTEKLFSKKIT